MKKGYTHFRNKMNENEQYYNGLGMTPRPTPLHQQLIYRFCRNIDFLLKQKNSKLSPVPEVELGKPNTVAPDIVIFQKKNTPLFALEIEKTNGVKGTALKTKNKAFPLFTSLKEVIIYDYQKKIF